MKRPRKKRGEDDKTVRDQLAEFHVSITASREAESR